MSEKLNYEYNDIKSTLIDVISERSEEMLVTENSVLKNVLEHKYDDAECVEILMDIENIYNLPVGEKPELEQKLLTAHTVRDLCDIFYMFLNNETVVVPQTQADVFEFVKNHIFKKYGFYDAKPEMNWSKDLGLSEFQRVEFFKWVSLKFGIKLPYFYFDSLDALCKVVFAET